MPADSNLKKNQQLFNKRNIAPSYGLQSTLMLNSQAMS